MNKEIEVILSELIVDNKAIPFQFLNYDGIEETYVTYQEISKEIRYADDYPFLTISTYDFDIYSKTNFNKIKDKLTKLLLQNGWLWVEDSEDLYEPDTRFFHKTVTFRKEQNYG